MANGVAFGILGLACVVVIAIIVIGIYFLLTLQRALARCHPDNRRMQPGLVWLNLVPCLNVVWQFLTAIQVPDSLKNEFIDRGLDEGGDYGKTVGLAYCILGLVGGFIQQAPMVAAPNDPNMAFVGLGLGLLFGVVNLSLGIIFWVRIAGYSRQLAEDDAAHDRDYDDDDPEDEIERPRRRRRRDEEDDDGPR